MARDATAIRARRIHRLCAAAVAFLLLPATLAGPGNGAERPAETPPKRIVSINACTDQLLFALADRGQIAALSRYAAEDDYSIQPEDVKASGIKLIKGSAEEVLKLKPDLVLAGSFTRRATRQQLKAFGIRLETFAPAESIEAAKADIRRTARMIGQAARGEALNAEIDGAVKEARAALAGKTLRLLQLRRNAYISGSDTLFDDALDAIGLVNAGHESGLKGTRQTSLEAVLKIRPDALVMFDVYNRPGDQGAAKLFHPVLRELYPPDRRVVLPGNQIVCGGPSLPLLLRSLARGVSQLRMAPSQ